MVSNSRNAVAILPSSQLATLDEIAKGLASVRGWKSWTAEGDSIRYVTEAGERCSVDTSGKAWTWTGLTLDARPEDDVNWAKHFGAWSNYVWAKDPDGNAVMLHD